MILTLNGVQYPNNSVINIEAIGENGKALICQTNKRPCCATPPYRAGEWYYPNGTLVPVEGTGSAIYRNRGDEGQVRLNRRNDVIYPIGVYCCEVLDAQNIYRSTRVGLIIIRSYGKKRLTVHATSVSQCS